MKKEYKRPVLFTVSALTIVFLVFFSLKIFNYYNLIYPNWKGKSKDHNWEVVFKKNEDAPKEFSGEILWIGDKDKTNKTYIKSITIMKDNKTLLDSSDCNSDIPIKDYSGGTSSDGSAKENSFSFLERLEESGLKGSKITVQVKWKQDNQTFSTEKFVLSKKTLFNH
ncbi:DUF4944 domain-containing protein [Bacillus mojavensis]|uniref:DUF4944 domain-containing protein n=1 Tax=Bacillus mojavensis TaxID=72360 RepID=UPI002DBB8CD9|nr:DUF4944 domain-containing protein [Bacillus mojavensis]MEC1627068.1 DUF4944 domain-containing protein [Bacillus mojavensis]